MIIQIHEHFIKYSFKSDVNALPTALKSKFSQVICSISLAFIFLSLTPLSLKISSCTLSFMFSLSTFISTFSLLSYFPYILWSTLSLCFLSSLFRHALKCSWNIPFDHSQVFALLLQSLLLISKLPSVPFYSLLILSEGCLQSCFTNHIVSL